MVNRAARKPWVGGNWKCNGSVGTNKTLMESYAGAKFEPAKCEVVVFPTAIHIPQIHSTIDKRFGVGLQNISKTKNGAFTGEISVDVAKDFGLQWTLIGHSERRSHYKENDQDCAEKIAQAQDAGLHVSFCIGETLEEREGGKTDEVCRRQIEAIIPKVTAWEKIVIAYEPVWAIGTGKVASPEQVQETIGNIRTLLKEKVSAAVAEQTRIVYGGSVSASNAESLIKLPDVDGFLVGGASLQPAFNAIIEAVASA